jgi:hypothetical protein
MLSTFELIINGFLAVAVLPLAVGSLLAGSKPPQGSVIAKYYQAEPYLMLTSNLLLLVVSAIAIAKLALHFGFIDASLAATIDGWLMLPLFATVLAFIGLYIRAILRVRRAGRA